MFKYHNFNSAVIGGAQGARNIQPSGLDVEEEEDEGNKERFLFWCASIGFYLGPDSTTTSLGPSVFSLGTPLSIRQADSLPMGQYFLPSALYYTYLLTRLQGRDY